MKLGVILVAASLSLAVAAFAAIQSSSAKKATCDCRSDRLAAVAHLQLSIQDIQAALAVLAAPEPEPALIKRP